MYRYLFAVVVFFPVLTSLQGCASGAEDSSKAALPRTDISPTQIIHNKDIIVELSCPAQNCAEIYYRINNSETATLYTLPFTLKSSEYANTAVPVTTYGLSNEGIKEKEHTKVYVVDLLAPENNGVDISGANYDTTQRVSLDCTDTRGEINSGCATFRYKFTPAGGTQNIEFLSVPYNQSVSINQTGILTYFAEDRAGNSSAVLTADYTFSNNLPNVSELASTSTTQSISLSWVNPITSTFSGVRIQRSDSGNAPQTIFDGSASTFEDVNVENGIVYSYFVFAVYSTTTLSSGVDLDAAVAGTIVATKEVGDLTITPSSQALKLNWVNPTFAEFDYVVVQQDLVSAPQSITDGVNVYTGVGSRYRDRNLANGITHYYTVFVIDKNGLASNGVSINGVPNDTTAPGLVSNVAIAAAGSTLLLTWKNPNDLDFAGTALIRKLLSYPSSVTDGDKVYEGKDVTFTDTTVTDGTEYFYSFFTFDGNGNYSAGTDVKGTPIVNDVPPMVQTTTPAANANFVDPTIAAITIDFSEDIAESSTTGSVMLVNKQTGMNITGTSIRDSLTTTRVNYNISNGPLGLASTYVATVSSQIQDLFALPMLTDYSWEFTTDDGAWQPNATIAENFKTGLGDFFAPSTDIAFDASDNAIVVWNQTVALGPDPYDLTVTGRVSSIYANRYLVKGGWDNANAQRISKVDVSSYNPKLAVMANGSAIVVWEQDAGSSRNIWAARFSANTGWENEQKIQSTSINAGKPQVAITGSGTVVVTWLQNNGIDSKFDVWATHFNFNDDLATVALANNKLLEDRPGDASGVSVAADAAGNAMVLWSNVEYPATSGAANNIHEVLFNRLMLDNANLASWMPTQGNPINTVSNTGSTISQTKISMTADGVAFAIWHTDFIRGSRFTISNGWEPEVRLSDPNEGNGISNLIALETYPNGDAIAAWYEFGQSYVAKYIAGVGWKTQFVTSGTPPQDVVSRAFLLAITGSAGFDIATDSSGNAIIFWDETSTMYAMRVLANDTLESLQNKTKIPIDDDTSIEYATSAGIAIDSKGRGIAVWGKKIIPQNQNLPVRYDLKMNKFAYIPPKPDLSIVIENMTLIPSGQLSIDYAISNANTAPVDNVTVGFFLNPNAMPAVGDVSDITDYVKTQVPAKSSLKLNFTTNIDVNVFMQGQAYAIVDNDSQIVEDDEANNVSASFNWALVTNQLDFNFENGVPAETIDSNPLNNTATAPPFWGLDINNNGPSGVAADMVSFRSTNTTKNTESCFSINTTDTSSVSFDYKAGTEENGDKFRFYVQVGGVSNFRDTAVLMFETSGKIAWTRWSSSSLTTPIVLGNNIYIWCYEKDSTVDTAPDAVWIDNIHIQ